MACAGGCGPKQGEPNSLAVSFPHSTATSNVSETEASPTDTQGIGGTGTTNVQTEPEDWQPPWPIEKQPRAYANPAAVIEMKDYSGNTCRIWGVQEKGLAVYRVQKTDPPEEFSFLSLRGKSIGLQYLDEERFLVGVFTNSRGSSYAQYDMGFDFYDPTIPSIFEEDVRDFQYVDGSWYYLVSTEAVRLYTLKWRDAEGDVSVLAEQVSDFQVANGTLYYLQKDCLYAAAPDGRYRKPVLVWETWENGNIWFRIMDEYIVYSAASEEGKTYFYNQNSGETHTRDIPFPTDYVSDTRYYYLTGMGRDGGVYRLEIETLTVEKLSDLRGCRPSLIDGELYFATMYEWDLDEDGQEIVLSEDGLYRMHTDGTGLERLA